MRDHQWLEAKLQHLLKTYFADMPLTNPLEIKWGREAKYRFGSIRLEGKSRRFIRLRGFGGFLNKRIELQENSKGETPKKSIITVTSMFADEKVPVGVIEYTICHELCHYAHGFSSTNKRMFKHPHHGGVINKELKERKAEHLIPVYRKWLKEYRMRILAGRTKF